MSGSWGTNLVYAAIQEFGGIIRATKAAYLHFRTKSGNWVKVKQVKIPAQPYLRPAADFVVSNMRTITKRAVGMTRG